MLRTLSCANRIAAPFGPSPTTATALMNVVASTSTTKPRSHYFASLAYQQHVVGSPPPPPSSSPPQDQDVSTNQTHHPNNSSHKLSSSPSSGSSSSSSSQTLDLHHLTFDDPKLCFRAIGSGELLKNALLLSTLRIPGLAKNSTKLLNLSNRVIGKKATLAMIRVTLFNHFCGGEDLNGLMKTGKRLNKLGIGSIVDYAAESEDTPTNGECPLMTESEDSWLDKNVLLTKDAISSAAQMREASKTGRPEDGKNNFAFVAMKVTALSSPALLRQLTSVLNFIHHLFAVACGHLQLDGCSSLLVDPRDHDLLMLQSVTMDQFTSTLKSVWPSITDARITELFNHAMNQPGKIEQDNNHTSSSSTDSISFFQWFKLFTPDLISTLPSPTIPSNLKDTNTLKKRWLTQDDVEAIHKVTQRMERVAEFAKQPEVRLLVDAEQTFFQTAIDYFAFQQLEKWNIPTTTTTTTDEKKSHDDALKSTPAIIYNTYQMYLKSSLSRLRCDAKRAEVFGYKNAVKMVRGAYMFQEGRCAEESLRESPVHNSLEETHESYNKGIEFMMNQLDQSELLCGTHNEDSTKLAASLLAKKYPGIHPHHLPPISFGQLLGMCDHMSLILSQACLPIYKYVPYGQVNLVMPYLIRRAEENSSLLSSSAKETQLIWSELRRRLLARIGVASW